MKMKKRNIFNDDGTVDLNWFYQKCGQHGKGWALRIAISETKEPEPHGVVLMRGCDKCAGYGMPGWIIPSIHNLKWAKCDCWSEDKEHWPFCKVCNHFTTTNTSGICHQCLDSKRKSETNRNTTI